MAITRCVVSASLAGALFLGLLIPVRAADEAKPVIISGYGAVAVPSATPYSPGAPVAPQVIIGPGGPTGPQENPGVQDDEGKPGEPGKSDDAKGKERPEAIRRPAASATSPKLDEFKVRPNAAGKVRLQFNGQPWQPVLEWLAAISGMSLDWQELPGDSLNLSTQRSYSVPEARDLINRLLLDRGYTLLCHGEVMTVAEIKRIDPSLVPRIDPADLKNCRPHEFVKVSFPLGTILAETAADDLKPMLSSNGRLTALGELNRLEAMDAVTNLRDIEAVLKEESEENQPRAFHEFKLKHARASEVHQVLVTLLGVESQAPAMPGGQPGGMQQEQMMMMARGMEMHGQPGQAMPNNGAPSNPKPKTAVTMAVNERQNSIFVQARPDKMAIIAQVVEAIDIPVSRDGSLLVNLNRMQVYRLAGIDPEPVVKTLMEIGNLDPATRLEVDKKNNAIVAYASLIDHVTIRAVVDKLAGSERKFEVIRLRRLEADYVAGTIEFMMGSAPKKEKSRPNRYFGMYESPGDAEKSKEFRVDADVEHNRLLLWANPVELAEIEALLVKLGEIPAAGSVSANRRVIDGGDAKETLELVERIRRTWPLIAPNALTTPATPPPEENKEPARPLPVVPKDSSTLLPAPSSPSPSSPVTLSPKPLLSVPLLSVPKAPDTAGVRARAALFHLADMRYVTADGAADGSPAGVSPGILPAEIPAVRQPVVRQPQVEAPTVDEPKRARTAPPVKIAVGPDGKLIVSSEDPAALDRMEELAAQLATPRRDYVIFRLRYVLASSVVLNLEEFFKEDKKERPRAYPPWYYDFSDSQSDTQDERRLSKRRKLTFISDSDSNTILVEGASAEQLKTIDELIQLYDQRPPTDSQSVRKTDIIRLKYSKAKTLADTVKDVYRDLLSANDKALASPNEQREPARNYYFNFNDDKTEPRVPKFKGLLSIGVDETSNSLVVSAPAYLFDHVSEMIRLLDEAAKPDYTVQMVHVGGGMSAKHVQELLNEVYSLKPASEKPAAAEKPAANSAKPATRSSRSSRRGARNSGEGDKEKEEK
jgi:hypothetical protein